MRLARYIARIFYQLLPSGLKRRIEVSRKGATNARILTSTYGQTRSMRSWESIDANGEPIPWYTYPAIEYLEHLDFSELSVFEYGSGNSTLWWARRARHVSAVENDALWHAKIMSKLVHARDGGKHIHYRLESESGAYATSLGHQVDVVIIDGRFRKDCVKHILSSRGNSQIAMIIFDNSDWYPDAVGLIREGLGWIEADFHGFGPINSYTWTTTIFANPEKWHVLKYAKPLGSLGGIAHNA